MCTVYLKYHNSHWLHFLHNAWPHPSGNHPHRDLSSNPQLLQIPSVLPGFSGSDPAFPTRRIPHTTSCCFPALHSRLFPPACQKMIVIHIRTHCIVRFSPAFRPARYSHACVNHGCWEELWFIATSMISRIPFHDTHLPAL